MSVIEAAAMRCRTMADGSLRIECDIEPRHAKDAFALFGAPGVPMALAALKTAAQMPPAPEPAKGGELSKWVAMRGDDPDFAAFIKKQAVELLPRAEITAALVRALCEVTSRAEIDNDPAARERFNERIRGPWIKRTQTEESTA